MRYDIKNDEFYTLTEAEIKERESQLAVYDATSRDFSVVICDYVWKFHYKERDEDEHGLYEPGYWYKEWDCQFIGGGGGGSWSGPGHGTGGNGGPGAGPGTPNTLGGGTSGSSSPVIVTTPVPKTQNEDPCVKLKLLMDPSKLNLDKYINDPNNQNSMGQLFANGAADEASYSFKTSLQ